MFLRSSPFRIWDMPASVLLAVTTWGTFVTCDDLHWAASLYEAETGIFAQCGRKDQTLVATKRQIAKSDRLHVSGASGCRGHRDDHCRHDHAVVQHGCEPVPPADIGGGP